MSPTLHYFCKDFIVKRCISHSLLILDLGSGGSLDLVKTHSDIAKFREATGACSVMLARAAMWNPSIFCSQGPVSIDEVMEEYIKYVSLLWQVSFFLFNDF